jgi:hypothetical protein
MLDRDIDAGTFIAAFKGNASGPGGLARLGRDYIVAAQTTRSALHFWTWHKVLPLQSVHRGSASFSRGGACFMPRDLSGSHSSQGSMGDPQCAHRKTTFAGSFTTETGAVRLPPR